MYLLTGNRLLMICYSVWKELVEFTGDEDEYIRRTAADILSEVFPYVSGKRQAYSDLVLLAKKMDSYTLRELVKKLAADCPLFYHEYEMSGRKREEMEEDKELRNDTEPGKDKPAGVHKLSSEDAVHLSDEAVRSRNPDEKQDTWSEVLKMAGDRDTGVRRHAAELISRIFPEVKERPGVFFDLVKLAESQDTQLRERAAELFSVAFDYSEEKRKAWDELLRLASDDDRKVRRGAILALSSGYAAVPDKEKAWNDLIRLSDHSDNFVKRVATLALGNAFFDAPDKTEAWRDLQRLTANPYTYVRKYAFRSLGKASLWRSLRADSEAGYIFGLKEAVKYFKEAAEVSTDTDVPDFYQPFYEALLSILFSDIPGIAKLESERYVSKISHEIRAVGESQQYFEILNQQASLLKNAGDLPPGDLSAQKKLLETSILTFEKFSSLFESKEEESILAPKTAKKEHPKPGKEILERVKKKKSLLFEKR